MIARHALLFTGSLLLLVAAPSNGQLPARQDDLPGPGADTIPSPQQVERDLQNLVARSLTRNRQMLALTQQYRARVEQWQRDGDPRFDPRLLEWYKQQEDGIRRLIRTLEPIRLPRGGGPPAPVRP